MWSRLVFLVYSKWNKDALILNLFVDLIGKFFIKKTINKETSNLNNLSHHITYLAMFHSNWDEYWPVIIRDRHRFWSIQRPCNMVYRTFMPIQSNPHTGTTLYSALFDFDPIGFGVSTTFQTIIWHDKFTINNLIMFRN